MKKIKCYSIHVKYLDEITPKAIAITLFGGEKFVLPKSQCFGQDYDNSKRSDSYWFSEWIIKEKDIPCTYKSFAWFDKEMQSDYYAGLYKKARRISVHRYTPDKIDAVDDNTIKELLNE